MRAPTLDALPPRPPVQEKAGYAALFTPHLRRNSVLIALGFFMHMFAFAGRRNWCHARVHPLPPHAGGNGVPFSYLAFGKA
ncbi:hypothetical protein NB693_25295 [Pantoea ananatis]|uniref:hypothetical protein n=1 Tax=Pantoea ananas TaxID=553 RepID=UPI00221EA305|nr:hypothetical protein [Pantoea ananatis]